MKKLLLLTQKGFTLVELMVVVAIIGILASIAIPNFNKYQANARKGEAKLGLASLYTAEQAFQTENGSYTACLIASGFDTTASAKRYFAVGFNNAGSVCGSNGSTPCINTLSGGAAGACPTTQVAGNASDVLTGGSVYGATAIVVGTASSGGYTALSVVNGEITGCANCAITQTEFKAGAAGGVEKSAKAILSINQNKSLLESPL